MESFCHTGFQLTKFFLDLTIKHTLSAMEGYAFAIYNSYILIFKNTILPSKAFYMLQIHNYLVLFVLFGP